MSFPFKFDREKGLEVILYIARRARRADRIHICKILYFSDKYHLEQYGRFITGDVYVAMQNGPVPSGAYDLIKAADRGELPDLSVNDYDLVAARDANPEFLSESDVEALDRAIAEYGNATITKLKRDSHDQAWESTVRNTNIPVERIALTLPDGEAVMRHLTDS